MKNSREEGRFIYPDFIASGCSTLHIYDHRYEDTAGSSVVGLTPCCAYMHYDEHYRKKRNMDAQA